jgi:hypothetical protein
MDERDLLRCLLHVIGRSSIPAAEVRRVVGKGKHRIKAFDLFDGRHTIQEVARRTKIDAGNLSRAADNWVRHGIAFWIGEGKDARLLHVYAIPEKEPKEAK